jgi:hypothetical protein
MPPTSNPYDYVGHIFFELDELTDEEIKNLRDILFRPIVMQHVYGVYYKGQLIKKSKIPADLIPKMEKEGYVIESVHVHTPNVNQSKAHISVNCGKTDCLYYDERYRGQCKIKIRATLEEEKAKIKGIPKKQVISSRIVVVFLNRDITELTLKAECIVDYIKERCGVTGYPDHFGKMELC